MVYVEKVPSIWCAMVAGSSPVAFGSLCVMSFSPVAKISGTDSVSASDGFEASE